MRDTKRTRVAAAAVGLSLLAAACGTSASTSEATDSEAASDNGGEAASGSITISGSSTVEPISSLNAELFREDNPDVQITVDGPGTGDGFELFCAGETDISDASRAIKDAEKATCDENGIEYLELKVGIDGLSVLTSPANSEVNSCLSFDDIYALVGPESEGFESWSDANDLAAEIGETQAAPFPDVPLNVTGPGEESGTYDTFVEFIIDPKAEERGVDAATRADYDSSPNDNVIIQGIVGSDTSFGWVGYAFYVENQDRLKAFEVDGGEGCVAPSDETIADGSYPLARPLFIYVNTAKADENPALADFVDFYLSGDGEASVAEVGYVNLADDEWQTTQSAWQNR